MNYKKYNNKKMAEEDRVKEIQEFVDNFNRKLKEAYTLYETKHKISKNLKKCHSQITNRRKTEGDIFPSAKKTIDKYTSKKTSLNKSLILRPQDWKPARGVPDYFEEFKGLKNKYELNTWEKVYKNNI